MSDTALATNKPLCFSKQIHDKKTSAIQHTNEPAIELYVRQQGNIAFKFLVINKKLIAEATRDGNIEQLPIDGIPSEFQTNLNEEKIAQIQIMLEQCYFGVQRGKVIVNVRGLGGWGPDVHLERTAQWAQQCNMGDDAQAIANACEGVDHGETNPDPRENRNAMTQEVQQWHFNTNYPDSADNSENDSRVMLAVQQMREAINHIVMANNANRRLQLRNRLEGQLNRLNDNIGNAHPRNNFDRFFDWFGVLLNNRANIEGELRNIEPAINLNQQIRQNRERAFVLLGRGLHPLQDMFAHTRQFILININNVQAHWPDFLGGNADNADFEPGRIANTGIATRLYLEVFNFNTNQALVNDNNIREITDHMQNNPDEFHGLLNAFTAEGFQLPPEWNPDLYQRNANQRRRECSIL